MKTTVNINHEIFAPGHLYAYKKGNKHITAFKTNKQKTIRF